LNRYFDSDEFAHLHWAYVFFNGEMPYRDFFYIFPPYFLLPVGLVLTILGRSAQAVVAVRGLMFIVQIAAYGVIFFWAKKLRSTSLALLTLVIFMFLPLPSDKLLEIRPDLLASVLAIAGLYLFVKAEGDKKPIFYFLSGFLLSASLVFVPKTIFFVIPVLAVILFRLQKKHLYFAGGFAVNLVTVAIFFLTSGKFWQAAYLTTKLAGDVTKTLGFKFYMRPDIFFYPNDTYYGMPGLSQTLIVNLCIYILGYLWGIKNFISAFAYRDKNKAVREFLFSASFIVNLYAFVRIYPLKHLQYLIPVAPFVAFYFADFVFTVLGKQRVRFLMFPVLGGLILYLTYLGFRMYEYKIPWNNKPTLEKVSGVLAAIPAGTSIFDLTGETIFYPDGYYFCCLPYGQYEEDLNFRYPEIQADMERRGTKYVHTGKTDRLSVLPIIQAKYIRENYSLNLANADPKLRDLGIMVRMK